MFGEREQHIQVVMDGLFYACANMYERVFEGGVNPAPEADVIVDHLHTFLTESARWQEEDFQAIVLSYPDLNGFIEHVIAMIQATEEGRASHFQNSMEHFRRIAESVLDRAALAAHSDPEIPPTGAPDPVPDGFRGRKPSPSARRKRREVAEVVAPVAPVPRMKFPKTPAPPARAEPAESSSDAGQLREQKAPVDPVSVLVRGNVLFGDVTVRVSANVGKLASDLREHDAPDIEPDLVRLVQDAVRVEREYAEVLSRWKADKTGNRPKRGEASPLELPGVGQSRIYFSCAMQTELVQEPHLEVTMGGAIKGHDFAGYNRSVIESLPVGKSVQFTQIGEAVLFAPPGGDLFWAVTRYCLTLRGYASAGTVGKLSLTESGLHVTPIADQDVDRLRLHLESITELQIVIGKAPEAQMQMHAVPATEAQINSAHIKEASTRALNALPVGEASEVVVKGNLVVVRPLVDDDPHSMSSFNLLKKNGGSSFMVRKVAAGRKGKFGLSINTGEGSRGYIEEVFKPVSNAEILLEGAQPSRVVDGAPKALEDLDTDQLRRRSGEVLGGLTSGDREFFFKGGLLFVAPEEGSRTPYDEAAVRFLGRNGVHGRVSKENRGLRKSLVIRAELTDGERSELEERFRLLSGRKIQFKAAAVSHPVTVAQIDRGDLEAKNRLRLGAVAAGREFRFLVGSDGWLLVEPEMAAGDLEGLLSADRPPMADSDSPDVRLVKLLVRARKELSVGVGRKVDSRNPLISNKLEVRRGNGGAAAPGEFQDRCKAAFQPVSGRPVVGG
ncbi:hypothetical protein [Streptomyces sp. NPDC051014]|uniref:hypothetical protein n=1 Tax=Streptomyces sp. NPDC051014 TaxID=3155751 RepID=UPI0033CF871D